MEQKLTIKQIAQMAGVSVAAVSYALNGKKGISDETRKRILDAIQNTNYTPNVNSRRLILQRSFNILLVLDDGDSYFDNFFYVEIINSIVKHCMNAGYNTVLVKLTEDFESSVLKNTLMQHNADGIVFLCDICDELKNNIEELGTPFVIVDSQKRNPPYPSVYADYSEASYCAVKHLIENGHKNVAMLDSGNVSEYYMCTYDGYKKALSEFDINLNSDWVKSGIADENDIKLFIDNISGKSEKPTAIFCSSDFVAVNVMNYLQRNGYTLPDDFSVCSIDDIILAKYSFPALTTVKIDKMSMGKLAVEMLDKLINEEETQKGIVMPSCELIVRDSVKKIN